MGMVENMAYVSLPGSGERFELFGPSQGAKLVAYSGAPLLGQLPVDPHIARLCDAGLIEEYASTQFEQLGANFLKTLHAASRPTFSIR